jgi:hypothetical protein
LVTLHEGRLVGKSECQWSLSWAKLSVNWGIDEFIEDYASQICTHFQTILSYCEENHWRSNPAVLMGLRIALVQKSKNSLPPNIVVGTVIKSDMQTIEMQLDNANTIMTTATTSPQVITDMGYLNSPTRLNMMVSSKSMLSPFGGSGSNTPVGVGGGGKQKHPYHHHHSFGSNLLSLNMNIQKYPGSDDRETITFRTNQSTFWIQEIDSNNIHDSSGIGSSESNNTTNNNHISTGGGTNCCWLSPDEMFLAKTTITHAQKKIFWEMFSVLTEYAEYAEYMKSGPSSPNEIGKLLKRPEFRVLWINEGIDFIPKEVATDLLVSAYTDMNSTNA